MRLYFAPLEGITGKTFREVHAACFPGVDRYCLPFLSPTQVHQLTPRERRALEPGPLDQSRLLPQLLTHSAEDFLWAASALAELGYTRVDLNLGCPSGTVVGKGKGAGMLRDPAALDRFLEAVFAACPIEISVKTRLGLEDPAEFGPILKVLSRYPIALLTVHPRTRRELYGPVFHPEAFARAAAETRLPLCYNGNLFTPADLEALERAFPGTEAAMLGRGMLADPALITRCKGGTRDRAALIRFHDGLCDAYLAQMHPNQAALPKLKELWAYLSLLFPDNGAWKRIRKARRWEEFYPIAADTLRSQPLLPEPDLARIGQQGLAERQGTGGKGQVTSDR